MRPDDRVDHGLDLRNLLAFQLAAARLLEGCLELRPAVVRGVQGRQELLEGRTEGFECSLLVRKDPVSPGQWDDHCSQDRRGRRTLHLVVY